MISPVNESLIHSRRYFTFPNLGVCKTKTCKLVLTHVHLASHQVANSSYFPRLMVKEIYSTHLFQILFCCKQLNLSGQIKQNPTFRAFSAKKKSNKKKNFVLHTAAVNAALFTRMIKLKNNLNYQVWLQLSNSDRELKKVLTVYHVHMAWESSCIIW